MFNILGIERPVFNISLESLSQKVEIKRVERGERVRKTVSDYEEEGKPAPRQPGYVERAYGEAALAEEEGRQLLYASESIADTPFEFYEPRTTRTRRSRPYRLLR